MHKLVAAQTWFTCLRKSVWNEKLYHNIIKVWGRKIFACKLAWVGNLQIFSRNTSPSEANWWSAHFEMGQTSLLVARILNLWWLSSASRTKQSRLALTLLFSNVGDLLRDFAVDSPKLILFGHLQKVALFCEKCSFFGTNGCIMPVNWLKTVN